MVTCLHSEGLRNEYILVCSCDLATFFIHRSVHSPNKKLCQLYSGWVFLHQLIIKTNICQSFLFVCLLVFVFVCLFVCLFCFVLFFRARVSLYIPGCPGPPFVEQAGLELRNLPASAFQVMGLNVCATMRGPYVSLIHTILIALSSDSSLCQDDN